jgi:hypothetical protein
MNSIQQRLPNYIDGKRPGPIEFESMEQLLEVAFIKHWSAKEQFLKFTISSYNNDLGSHHLMAEMADGEFWVIGYLKEAVDLPKWDIDICEARLPNRKIL